MLVFANTFLMKRRFFARIFSVCVCLSFCCTACKMQNTPTQISQRHSLSHPSSSATQIAQPIQDTVWDVSDIPNNTICNNKKYISFTFDDAPASTLDAIVGTFLTYNQNHPDCPASATLFCNGIRFHKYGISNLQTAYLIGFEMGNHTHSHVDLTKLDENQLRNEIDRTDRLLQKIDSKARHLLRAPFGCMDERLRANAHSPIISWTIDTLDWTGISAQQIYQSVWNHRFNGAIVLMHDGYENTVEALKRLLPDLYADGYQVLSVSALSKANACPLKIGSVYIRARKNGGSR